MAPPAATEDASVNAGVHTPPGARSPCCVCVRCTHRGGAAGFRRSSGRHCPRPRSLPVSLGGGSVFRPHQQWRFRFLHVLANACFLSRRQTLQRASRASVWWLTGP